MPTNRAPRLALFVLAALAAIGACGAPEGDRDGAAGSASEARPRAETPEPLSEAAAGALPVDELRAKVEALVAAAPDSPADEAAIERLRRTAGMLRVLALRERDAGERGAASLERARALLTRAADAGDSAASCRAQAERVRLESLDARDLPRAHALAREGARRFRASPAASECARLLAGAAHALAGAARTAGDPIEEATLSRITVYGADAEAPLGVRVLFELDRPIEPESIERPAAGERPRSLWLDFAATSIAAGVPAALEVGAGGLLGLRRSQIAGGTARVELDLDPRAVVRRFTLEGPHRVVVDLSLPRDEVASPSAASRPIRRVVLDPGHGGDEWGASSGGVRESHLVFDIARRAAAALSARLPGLEVLLTRDDDVIVPLEDRTRMANEADADLFVSVHLNDSDVAIQRGGITTFVLDTTDDAQALRLAARENGTTPAEVTGMTRLLADLHRSGQVESSRALAERIHGATLTSARTVLPGVADRGVRSALFAVLVGARMPAVLVEASFLTHPDELRALRTTGYRQALGEGIAAGIAAYIQGE